MLWVVGIGAGFPNVEDFEFPIDPGGVGTLEWESSMALAPGVHLKSSFDIFHPHRKNLHRSLRIIQAISPSEKCFHCQVTESVWDLRHVGQQWANQPIPRKNNVFGIELHQTGDLVNKTGFSA